MNGLRNFSDNTTDGDFAIENAYHFTPVGDFANAGTVAVVGLEVTIPEFTIPDGHTYTQSAGKTLFSGGKFSGGQMNIAGGEVFGRGAIESAVMIGDARFSPAEMSIFGNISFSTQSLLHFDIPFAPSLIGPSFSTFPLDIDGTASFAGELEIAVSSGYPPGSDDTFLLLAANAVSGAFSNVASGSRLTTADGRGSFVVNYGGNLLFLSDFETIPPSAQLLNISARAEVLDGERVLIGGFVITGSAPKKVILRAIGPSLTNHGVANALQDPVLELHDNHGVLFASNDNWKDNQQAQIEATTIPPANDSESAIVATLQPGAYTAVVRGKNSATGTALFEIYDLAAQSDSKLANLSARGFVDGNDVLIAGVIAGGDPGDEDIVFRAIGPDLARAGIQNPLPDPTLDIRDSNGMRVAFNDDQFMTSDGPDASPIGFTDSEKNSFLRLSLAPGLYTAIVQSKNGEGGIALIETYDLHR